MRTVLFIHGINVREKDLDSTMQVVQQHIHSRAPSAKVSACSWGVDLGARLRCDGKSIPGYDSAMAAGEVLPELQSNTRWMTLYQDPFFELRLLANAADDGAAMPPNAVQNSETVRRKLRKLPFDVAVAAAVGGAGLGDYLDAACSALASAPAFDEVLVNYQQAAHQLPTVLGRSVVALMIRDADSDAHPVVQGSQRDSLVTLIEQQFGGAPKGVLSTLTKPLLGLALGMGTRYLQRNRGKMSDLASPVIGDLMCYQGRGEPIRQRIAAQLTAASEPLVVIAHSLGGVAVVDALLLAPALCGKVAHLHTVGSQAGFFYEINALVGRSFPDGAALPAAFPAWTNFYDRSDMLSYLANPIFGAGVQDVEIDNGQPFPQSHSGYWTNDKLWDAIVPSIAS
jgi:hypothetical protein